MIPYLFIGIGIWLLYIGIEAYITQQANNRKCKLATQWPTAQAKILSSKIELGRNKSSETGQTYHTYTPHVEYSYEVDDNAYTGKQITFRRFFFYNNRDDADAFSNRYPEGAIVPVYYNPAKPGEAILESTPAEGTIGDILMPGIGAGLLILGLLGVLGII